MNTMKKIALLTALFFLLTGTGFAADQTIASTEEMVGSGHATKTDTLNRHGLVGHETDGTHKTTIVTTTGTVTVGGTATVGGNAVNTTLPAFLAIAAQQNNMTGDGTLYSITFGTEIFDQGNNFDGTSTFTAPVTGKYLFQVTVEYNGLAAANTRGYCSLYASNRTLVMWDTNVGATLHDGAYNMFTSTQFVDMDAGDTVVIKTGVSGGTKIVGIEPSSHFSGYLVG